ncbi:GTPase RsgA, partial [Mycoplasmopsis synoviae]|uniref:GTPase RsgA n=1 Tax=Mycoplasmopsis synoviae TaxID=2109 RepID=UPI00387AD78B
NIDQVLVFLSVKEPDFSSFLLDKYLAIVESKNIDLMIFLTKSDLDLELANHCKQKYEMQNYKVFLLSSNDNNCNEIKKLFDKKFSIVMGQSGVGKTTFINNISNN